MATLLVSHHRPGFYFRVWRKVKSALATKSRKWRMAPNTSLWRTSMRSIFAKPLAQQIERSAAVQPQPGWKTSLKAIMSRRLRREESGAPRLKQPATSLARFFGRYASPK